jgi:hypothetical protein
MDASRMQIRIGEKQRERLSEDTSNEPGRNGPAALADVEPLAGVHRQRMVCVDDHFHVVTGHDHFASVFHAFRPGQGAHLVCSASAHFQCS